MRVFKYKILVSTLLSFCLGLVSFGQERTTLLISGLQDTVEVLRDQWGVNHIYAKNQHDLFFAQGYCAARDRLFQFEIWRRQATGTVAEVLGPSEIKRDIGARLFRYRGDMKKELSRYHKDGQQIITAFVEGVNTYIKEVLGKPDILPFEFKLLGIKPDYWTPEVVISRHQGLKGNVEKELQVGRAVALAGEEKVKDLMWFHPKSPDLNMDSSINDTVLSGDILELYTAFTKPVSFENNDRYASNKEFQVPQWATQGVQGSNNWVVSGDRTKSGFPFLANDPHRRLAIPSLRYMVHLNAPGWNVIGGGEPVIPGISIGHNDHGAWGLTIFETDAEDLYVYDLNPDDLTQYQYKGAWVAMEEIEERIPVAGKDSVPVTLRYTVHGPVTYIDTVLHKAFAVRCAWLEPGGAPYLTALRINQSKNWKDFRKASKYNYLPGENMIWADREGTIGWQVVGIAPIRTRSSGMVPVPGDGRYEWDGFLDIRKRPHEKNPKKGFIATANQSVTPEDYPFWNTVGYTWADPFRGNRITEVLAADTQRTLLEEKELQSDYFSIPARTLVPLLEGAHLLSDTAIAARKHLAQWDFYLQPGSISAAIYAMWERTILREANKAFIPEKLDGLIYLQLSRVIEWLTTPADQLGAEYGLGREAFLSRTFELAIKRLVDKLGNSMSHWQYGQEAYKHVTLYHPLHDLLPKDLQDASSLGPVKRGGNSYTPNSTGAYDNQVSGATFRIITDLEDWDKMLMINAPGQSGDVRSKYYNNLFLIWADNAYFPAYFSKDKIKANTDEITVLKPVFK